MFYVRTRLAMDHPMSLRLRSLVLVSMVLLGFQFCVPLVVRAADATHSAEMLTVGTKDPECRSGVHLDLDLPAPCIVVLLAVPVSSSPTLRFVMADDRVPVALLPVTGLHPSAP